MSNDNTINTNMQKTNSTSNNTVVDDTQTVIASSHLLVREKNSQLVLVNQRGS
jgi:hypothetical protein